MRIFWAVHKSSLRIFQVKCVDGVFEQTKYPGSHEGHVWLDNSDFLFDPLSTPCDLYDEVFRGSTEKYLQYNMGNVMNNGIEWYTLDERRWVGGLGCLDGSIYRHKISVESIEPVHTVVRKILWK